jgi:transcription elongation factor GreA
MEAANEKEEYPMRNELTRKDIELMRQELEHRRGVLRPQLIEAVKEARAFGDLSENFEYKAAKKEKNRNDSRCRYLENMIKTAVVISEQSAEGVVGLYDKVTLYVEEDDEEITCQIVTTMRQDALKGRVSKESPVGRAVLGRRAGERVTVQVNDSYSYDVVIRAIEPGEDNGEAPLVGF